MVKRKSSAAALDVPVEFGGVSIGKETARLGIKISRDQMPLEAADEALCERRLMGKVVLGHADDLPGQSSFLTDSDLQVEGSFDVKRFGVTSTAISAGLTFPKRGIDLAALAKFSKGRGRVIIDDIVDIPDDDEEPEVASTDADPSLRTSTDWRQVSIETLGLPKGTTKALVDAGLETVGKLADYTGKGSQLVDIPKLGPAAVQKVEDRLVQFWATNPDLDR